MAKRNTTPKNEPEVVEQEEQELNDTSNVPEDNATTPPATETKPEIKSEEVVQHIVTLGTVQHSGKVYQVGDKIDLPKKDLLRLIDLGVVKQV